MTERKNALPRGRPQLGLDLEAGAKQILAHVKGRKKLATRRIVLPEQIDVKQIRTAAGMSQAAFARTFCILDALA